MAFTLVSLGVAFVIRLVALYIALSREFIRIDKGIILILAAFSTLLGFVMPPGFLDITGLLFRIVLFAIIVMVLARCEFLEALGIVIVAAVIESIMIIALMITPFSWMVAGMGPLTIP